MDGKIVGFILTCGIALLTTAGGLFECVKIFRLKKKLECLTSYTCLSDVIFDAVKVAESKYKAFERQGINCSELKKQDVIQTAQTASFQNGWEFDIDEVNKKIEELIDFSKNVNSKVGR